MKVLTATFFLLALATPLWAQDALFDDLGGQPGIDKLVDASVDNYLADPRIKDIFSESNIDRIRAELKDQFCVVAGGLEYCFYPLLSHALLSIARLIGPGGGSNALAEICASRPTSAMLVFSVVAIALVFTFITWYTVKARELRNGVGSEYQLRRPAS